MLTISDEEINQYYFIFKNTKK